MDMLSLSSKVSVHATRIQHPTFLLLGDEARDQAVVLQPLRPGRPHLQVRPQAVPQELELHQRAQAVHQELEIQQQALAVRQELNNNGDNSSFTKKRDF